jgi:hypothetical protein
MATTKKPTAPQSIHQLHVALLDVTPVIRRRLWIPGNLKISKLDRVKQEAFGWTNSHLHEFRIAGDRYGMTEIESIDGDEDLKSDKKITVAKVLPDSVKEFEYEYDFGDGWRHRVVVEGTMAATRYNDWPLCLSGENACPPEGIGDPGGFEDFMQSMADHEEDDHFENWNWHSGPFVPKGFDVNTINTRIRKLH